MELVELPAVHVTVCHAPIGGEVEPVVGAAQLYAALHDADHPQNAIAAWLSFQLRAGGYEQGLDYDVAAGCHIGRPVSVWLTMETARHIAMAFGGPRGRAVRFALHDIEARLARGQAALDAQLAA
ncbi:hypothetical protein QR66_05180 [Chromobacterium piscinae]|nr:hypothetical protein QR66_05180 [Chromobacterium piscinae]